MAPKSLTPQKHHCNRNDQLLVWSGNYYFFIVFILTSVISLIGNLFYDQLTDYALILISVMKNDLTTHKVSAAFISVVGPFQEICQCSQTSVCDITSGGFVLLLHL